MNKFKKLLLATCLMVPCALSLTACGDKEGSSNVGGKGGICANNSCQYTKIFTPTDFMDTEFYTWATSKNFSKRGNQEYNAWIQENFFHVKDLKSYSATDGSNVYYHVYHAAVCETCGNVKAEKHTFEHIENLGDFDHNVRCTGCGYTHTGYCYFEENGELDKTSTDCFCGHEQPKYTVENDPENPNGMMVCIDSDITGDIVIPRMAKGKVVTRVRFSIYGDWANQEIKSITIPYTALNGLDLPANNHIEKIIVTGYTQAEATAFEERLALLEQQYSAGTIEYYEYHSQTQSIFSQISPDGYRWIKLNGLSNLKSIEIAENNLVLSSLDVAEIKNCTSLETVYLDSYTTSFNNCPSLRNLTAGGISFGDDDESTLPQNLTDVTLLTLLGELMLPQSVKNITISDLYAEIPDRYFENMENLETISGVGVNRIRASAFNGCTSLKSINFPEVTKIERQAFYGCTSLESASFPKLQTTEYNAFDYCTSLETLDLGDRLQNIASDLCSNCINLKEITIPETVTEIGGAAFFNCKKLKTIRYNAVNASMAQYAIELFKEACSEVEGGAELIIGKNVEVLPENLTVASGVDVAANAINITKVTFEDGSNLKTIEENAISCLKITTITLPSSITTVENDAFYSNFFLETINFGSLDLSASILNNCPAYVYEVEAGLKYFGKTLVGVESIVTSITPRAGTTRAVELNGVSFVPETIKPYIESVVMPHTIIEWKAPLSGLTNLSNVTLSSSLTSITMDMFRGCANLTSIAIPASVEYIENNAFYGTGLTEVVIPASVVEICGYAFYNCTSLTSVTLNEGLVTIGEHAFGLCKTLPSLTLPSTVRNIGKYAFISAGSDLATPHFDLTLNEGLTELGYHSLSDTYITSISFPSTLVSIKEGAFYNTELTSVTIPEGITVIERNTFFSCNSLATISLPSTLKTIRENAFGYCWALETITIPASVELIEDYAFANCKELETINLEGNVTLTTLAVDGCTKYKGQLVDGLYYKGTVLSALADTTAAFVYILEGTTEIASGVFANLTTLRGVYIPEGCTTIPTDTFTGCTNVTLLFGYNGWTSGLTGINYGTGQAIRNATVSKTGYLYETASNGITIKGYYGGEKNVVIPETIGGAPVVVIGNMYDKGAFEGNTYVESVTMGSNVFVIYENAFKNCTSLTTVTMAAEMSVFNIGAFAGCTNLTTVNITGNDFAIYAKDPFEGNPVPPVATVAVDDPNFISYLTTEYANHMWIRNLQFVG